MPQSAPADEGKPVLSQRGGPVGAEIGVVVIGLPPFQRVRIGFGSLSQYEVLGGKDADATGTFDITLYVPQWAELDRVHFFVASYGGNDRPASLPPRVLSEPFHVTNAEGIARIYGTISPVATSSCLAVDGPDKTLYTLEGDTGLWSPGQRVMVIGTIADRSACGSKGVPITVKEIRPSL